MQDWIGFKVYDIVSSFILIYAQIPVFFLYMIFIIVKFHSFILEMTPKNSNAAVVFSFCTIK